MIVGVVVERLGFAGGLELYAHQVGAGLRARGHRVVLVHAGARGRDPEAYAGAFDATVTLAAAATARLDVAYVQAPRTTELAPLGSVPRLFAAHDHDLTCARSHRYLPLSHVPCHRAPGVACVAFGCVVRRSREHRLGVTLRSPRSLTRGLRALSRSGRIVACSRYVADCLVAGGSPADRVAVVHPVPREEPRPLCPPPSVTTLLAVGQLVRGKGFDLAIRALPLLAPSTRLCLVGDGPMRSALESLARAIAPGQVHFAGYVSAKRVVEHYDAATLVLVPSRWPEPFGMVGIEAMRRARPVVGAAPGGIPEWLDDGVGGRLFTPGDPAALATAIRRVLADRDAGERAHADVRRRFDHAAMIAALEQLLVEAAA